jgi:hypothetical protein
MKIRLKKDAPWPVVTMPDGFVITKTNFVEQGDENLFAIQQWIENDFTAEPDPIPEGELNYSSMTKIDLILLSRERGINIEGFSKQQIIEALEKQQK